MNGKFDLPDVHFGQVVPVEDLEVGDPDNDPDVESEEEIKKTKELYKRLYDIDIDELFDEDGDAKPDDDTEE